jgi:hypothetical protein
MLAFIIIVVGTLLIARTKWFKKNVPPIDKRWD